MLSSQTAPLPIAELFTQLLDNMKYDEAIDLYHTIVNLSEENAQQLKALFILHLRELLQSPQTNGEKLVAATDSYLQDFYDDTEIRLILAQHHLLQKQFYEGINAIQLAKSYAYSKSDQEKVLNYHQLFIKSLTQHFYNTKDWQQLIDIYLFADTADLLPDKNRIQLIDIYLNTGDVDSALSTANSLAQQSQWEKPVASILDSWRISQAKDQEATTTTYSSDFTMDVIKRNNQFIVPVTLSNNETLLLLDTGASITTISKAYFESIRGTANLTFKGRQSFLTANGKTIGEIYTADIFNIGQYNLRDINIAVLDYPTSREANGLLGMNVLKHFQFSIDQDAAKITLIKK